MDVCWIVYVSAWPRLWPLFPVASWSFNYSCVEGCVSESAVVCVCMRETVCFCGSSNQPPAPSPNTCSPINIQRAGAHSLLSPCFPPLFLPLFSLFSHSGPCAPFRGFVSAPRHTPLGLFICSHMLLWAYYFHCLIPSLLSLFFLYPLSLFHHHHPQFPVPCLILP